MIEEALVTIGLVEHGLERQSHSCLDLVAGRVAALVADTKSRQSEPNRSDACGSVVVATIDMRAVFNQAGLRMRLLPEKLERRLLDLIQQLLVRARVGRRRRRSRA